MCHKRRCVVYLLISRYFGLLFVFFVSEAIQRAFALVPLYIVDVVCFSPLLVVCLSFLGFVAYHVLSHCRACTRELSNITQPLQQD